MTTKSNLPRGEFETSQNGEGFNIGALLRASRNRLGKDIRDAADTLRIRAAYLEAIEDGRFGDLPGPTYTVGFIRAYADYLGLDGGEVVRRYKCTPETSAPNQKLSFPTPVPDRGLPGGAILMIGIVIAVIGYGGWYFYTSQNSVLAELVPAVPDRLTKMLDGALKAPAPSQRTIDANPPPDGSSTPPAAVAATPPVMTTAPIPVSPPPGAPSEHEEADADTPAAEADGSENTMSSGIEAPDAEDHRAARIEPAATGAATPMPAEPATDAATRASETSEAALQIASLSNAEPVRTPAPSPVLAAVVAPSESTPADAAAAPPPRAQPATATETFEAAQRSNIEVRAKSDSWIQVRDDRANQLVMTRLLKGGDSFSVPNRQGLTMLTGNAGALQIIVDGEAVPALGPVGAVRRRVALDPMRLKAGTAVIE